MDLLRPAILGIVQGLTEFLPVSSSGHLVIFQELLGLKGPQLLLDVALHVGTLAAVLIYFRSDLRLMVRESWEAFLSPPGNRGLRDRPHAVLLLWVIMGTIPTGLIALLLRGPLEQAFASPRLAGVMLLVTGGILLLSRLAPRRPSDRRGVGLWRALAVGAAQGLAVCPGLSRSGTTIVCGLLTGLDRELAGRFSFLLSIPAILGALVLEWDSQAFHHMGWLPVLLGFAVSAAVGLLALRILMGMLKKGRLALFAPYCFAAGLLVLLT